MLKAREKLRQAESESDIQTDVEEKRKRKPSRKLQIDNSGRSDGEDSSEKPVAKKKYCAQSTLENDLPSVEDFRPLEFYSKSKSTFIYF